MFFRTFIQFTFLLTSQHLSHLIQLIRSDEEYHRVNSWPKRALRAPAVSAGLTDIDDRWTKWISMTCYHCASHRERRLTNSFVSSHTGAGLISWWVSLLWVSVVINAVNSEGLWLAVTVCIVNQIALKAIPAMSYVTFTVVLLVLHLSYDDFLKKSSYLCSFRSRCGQPLTATDNLKCHFIYPEAL